MKKIFYNKSLIKLIFILTLVLLFFNGSFSFGASPDAIGFRVIPNSNHLSPLRWYQENIKLKGSPQVLNVDGYEAVRDGRTVYVNAANIDLGAVPQKLYTNIYIISYNQQAENATLDIFGQILEHWKFTTNLSQEGVCSRTMDKTCLYTSECPSGEYCLSKKATVIRDTKRLADLADIKTVLDSYQKEHSGKYPSLSAGSYLPGKSISKWPSWRGTLSKDLGAVMPFDPINKLGKCRADCCAANNCVAGSVEKSSCNYNQETCWDEKNKKFADRTPPTIDFDLPVDSRAYVYIASSTGASFTLCANMESVYVGTADGSCLGNTLANNPPVIITNSLLPGRSGAKYRGFVQARDPDGDILSWSISLTGTDWTDWVGEPILKNTGVNNQIEIYADQAGANKSYSIAINVRDNRGGEVTKIFAINVGICTDGDEDGFFSEGGECGPVDCDDENEDIYPGAAETCDGADNNCDGVRDEGCQVIVTYCGDNTIQDDSQNDDGVKEKCDGGNAVSGDGCNENCQIERIIVTFCGDGEIQNNPDDNLGIAETCDDGNTINDGNGCDENCQCASGYHRDGSNCVINSGTKACGSKTELNSAWYGTGTFNQTWNNGIYYPETWASTYSLTDTPSDQCDYHCVDSYHYTSTPAPYGSCVTNSETGDCSGEPLNSVWWDGVGKFTKNWINNDWSPLSKQGSYSAATTVTECAYKCADNFVWQDPLCVPACQGIAANSIILNDGVINSENTVYSDNNDTDTAIRVDGGNYLKLGRSLPTPYLWIANTDINKVAKIRTFEGPQRQCRETGAPYRLLSSCNWVTGIANEPMGKLIGTYSVGADPSRTAVNAETGDVWIGNRKDGSVTKLTINGNPLKVCSSSDAGVSPVFKYGTPGVMYPGTAGEVKYPKGLIRGVAIDEAGDVWLADYFGDRLIKIPGGDTGCTPIAVVTNVLQPYGLSIDSDNNVWAVQAFYGVSKVSKNPVTGTYTVVGYPSGINGGYGITVDMDDNIWTGGHASPGNGATTPMNGYALIKYPKDTPNRPEHFIPNVSGLGVSIDLLGNIWVANYKSPSVYRINPNNTADISGPFDSISQSDINDRLIPKDSRGVAGDSQGNMWVVNYETGKIRALNSVGGFLGDYNAYKKRPTWPITEFSRTYSYSDMTGLNRAMIFRTAYWVSKTFVKLPAFDNYYWGETDFNLTIPILDKTSAKVFIQTNSDPACSLTNWPVGSESQYTKAEWNALPKASRKSKCLRIKIELSSKAKGITPVFSASESSLICN